ncbi:HAD family hydrolase [Burkholderia multivorans]|uniref:HAD hydrolase-like protein n=1 Tax=Burkholderia ubonensis TaxID=101571 RepID=UPI000F6BC846|nr:HAD hydrolase-like protein [Burkholderia ubonensis]AYZ62633.1 HAD family hydrolase [Burkholderia multivorans]VWC13019.1 hydrolase [Burkholderia ubonensis]
MSYQLIAFDFDGTLADSFDCFLAALSQASRLHGFRDVDDTLVATLRGLSARDIIRALEVPPWKVPRVTLDMRRLMQQRIADVTLFPGVAETFDALAARGVRIAIATSNSEAVVRDRLGAQACRHVGHFACGIPLFGKSRRLRALARDAGLRTNDVLYVGDEIRDADAARRANVAFQGVAWGYTAPDTLQKHCATPLLTRFDALLDVV